jgi:arylsulfatase A-like enzyme
MNQHLPSRRAFMAAAGGLLTTTAVGGVVAGTAESEAFAAARAEAGADTGRRPNFVIVLADDLGWGELGCYGQDKIRTPNLDRLAAEGLRFTDAYAGAPVCAPSRASLLTGLDTGHSTVQENPRHHPQHSLTSADVTFGSLLKLAGYRTACIGKWGFGPELPHQASHPNSRGFGEFFGYITHKQAHQYWPEYLWHNHGKVELDRTAYAPDLFVDHAKTFITAAARAHEPFLLYYATNLPHAPSAVPGDAGRYRDEPWPRADRRHAAQVTRLDDHVGQIMHTLREAGVADSTVVLFAGDNGPHHEKGVHPRLFNASGPYRGGKRDLYEGGIRVPMIAWGPGLLESARVVRDAVAFWDVLPTLADLAGVPVPDHLDGRSLRGLLTGGHFKRHDSLFWNYPGKAQAIRRGDWKCIRFTPQSTRFELYDLAVDPGEKHNLAEAYPEIVTELDGLMTISVGPDERRPYRMELTGARRMAGGRPYPVQVTLSNGSATTWRNVRIRLRTPKGWRVHGTGTHLTLRPGVSTVVTLTVTPPRSAKHDHTLECTARFTAHGRDVRFRTHRKITVEPKSKQEQEAEREQLV